MQIHSLFESCANRRTVDLAKRITVMSPYTPWSHIGGEVILLHLFLTSAVDGGECWDSRPTRKELPAPIQSRRPYGPHSRHLDVLDKFSISCPCPKLINAIFAKVETFLLFNVVFTLDSFKLVISRARVPSFLIAYLSSYARSSFFMHTCYILHVIHL